MVNYRQLNSAKPGMWSMAAEDWLALTHKLANEAGEVAKAVHQPVVQSGWSGMTGETAVARIQGAYAALEAAGVEVSAVAETLRGLADTVVLAQRTLAEAKAIAAENRIEILSDGSLEAPSGGGQLVLAAREEQITDLINEALREATQADGKASAELKQLAIHASRVDVTAAGKLGLTDPTKLSSYIDSFKNEDLNSASRVELEMINGAIPTGPPEFVGQWWAGLDPAEQEKLKLAVPGKLGTLDGIPPDVQSELRGSDGIDRVALVNYALQNWNNTNLDIPDQDNCTNFVSDALAAAGMHQQNGLPGWPLTRDDKDVWYGGGDNPVNRSPSSHTWTDSQYLSEYMTSHGSQVVTNPNDVKPGDVVFWAHGGPDSAGLANVHHAAVVTAVVDDHVYYTQHTGGAVDADLNLREPTYDITDGRNTPIVVRPHQD